jgi:pimeloyl-ACP methyl ester carboxylesterase
MKVTPFRLTTDEGLPIRGDLHVPDRAGASVIVCVHGFKGFKDWGFWPETARRLCEAGYGVVRFNLSHSGIGEDLQNFTEVDLFETGTYTREVEDLRQVLRALRRAEIAPARELDAARPGLIGHSRGAVSVLAAAAAEPVGSIVLWNPVSSLIWWDKEARRRWRETGVWQTVNKRTGQTFAVRTGLLDDAENNRDALHPLANAARIEAPLLVLVAADDESVPPEAGRRLARAAPAGRGSLRELPGTGHTFGAAHPWQGTPAAFDAALAATLEHFDRTLAKSSS